MLLLDEVAGDSSLRQNTPPLKASAKFQGHFLLLFFTCANLLLLVLIVLQCIVILLVTLPKRCRWLIFHLQDEGAKFILILVALQAVFGGL